jgi:DNA-directed RNA polymerase subunit beta'
VRTTIGQLLVNEVLPPDLRDYHRTIDKKSIRLLLREVAASYPEQYNEIASKLMNLGAEVSTTYGNEASVSLNSLKIGEQSQRLREHLKRHVDQILAREDIGDDEKNDRIIKYIGDHMKPLRDLNFQEQLARRNAFAMQVHSGARGNPAQFAATNVGDMLVIDHRDNVIPVPILNSYSEGLDPVEYWAGSYGARKGMVDLKFATPKGGFLGKQLALAAHRLKVSEDDCGTTNGIPVDGRDPDNEGALLARPVGDYDKDTVLDSKTLKRVRRHKMVIIRSPMTCQAKGGICAKCAGVRERGRLPEVGDNIGIAAAQAISEPVSQSAMSSKHSGGIAGAGPTAGGFDAINQLTQVPKTFKGGAAISKVDGVVQAIEPAPQGGVFITIGRQRHYAAPDFAPIVKKGDTVEAGDVLSEGLPNPSEIVRLKGIGAGRWHFMNIFRDTLRNSKISANRRNIELLARGLINHARITDEDGPQDTLPDDVVEFDNITRGYKPRFGFKSLAPRRAVGQYLEEPILHYSIGTRITPRIAAELKNLGFNALKVHRDMPSFEPEMVRAMDTLAHNEDWMVQLGGFHLKRNLLESVHRARGTREQADSYIPSMARGVEFGT